MRHTCWTY